MSIIKLMKCEGNTWIKIALIIYVLSFFGALFNHSLDIIRGGLFPYQKLNQDVHSWLNIYWTMLTVLDLGAIIVLFRNIEIGLWLYLVIIVSDVIINYSFVIENYGLPGCANFGQICQLLFMIFVLATFIPIRKIVIGMEKSDP